MERAFKVKGMDHVALTVRDIEASVNFYHKILGLELLRAEEYAAGKVSFLSVRLGEMLIDLFPAKAGTPESPAEGGKLNHFCIYVETSLNWEDFVAQVKATNIPITRELRHNWGAFGYGDSVYVLDPDGNSVELKKY